eukprot:jgi/Botrbrau1/12679/Bobra.67_1s0043.1
MHVRRPHEPQGISTISIRRNLCLDFAKWNILRWTMPFTPISQHLESVGDKVSRSNHSPLLKCKNIFKGRWEVKAGSGNQARRHCSSMEPSGPAGGTHSPLIS